MSRSPRTLTTQVRVREHYLRSAHLEHHSEENGGGYIPTGRALEVVHRIARSMSHRDTSRAWTLTGPYGSGKSSFALFLGALLGPSRDAARRDAETRLAAADAGLAAQLNAGRSALGAATHGFIRATVTAQREPVVDTVFRALSTGARTRWRTGMPTAVRTALRIADEERTPRSLIQALEHLCQHGPVLIAIDEFGKNLEHFASDPAAADLFLLQELAERATGRRALPVFVLTLQHLAFDDYVRAASAVQRAEWGKVQGRFEDIPFVESAEQSMRLVAGALDSDGASRTFLTSRKSWARDQHTACERLGLSRLIVGGQAALEACYPLHPITLLALPEMCARFGQNGRTLFSFLTSREPHSVAGFLDTELLTEPLPSVPLDQLYDFFLASGVNAGSRQGARLAEIDQALRETTGLTQAEQRVLKVIGVLNLLSQGGPMRASLPVIRYALGGPDGIADRALTKLLGGLQTRGVLTFRGFADEYRIWQGSDLDLASLIAIAREEQAMLSPAALLDSQHAMPAVIAGRHSQRVGMLRYFETRFADPVSPPIPRPAVIDDPDGLVVYYLGPPETAHSLVVTPGAKPVVLATTPGYAAITETVTELSAVRHVLDRPEVQADRVARRELQDRAADARRRLDSAIAEHLRPDAPGVVLQLIGEDRPLKSGRSLSSILSDVCDAAYRESPELHNEMVARRTLTSQGAKARGDLLEAMVEHANEEWLGLTGFGPEKAMYAALLRTPGIHRADASGHLGFHPPQHDHLLRQIWSRIDAVLDRATGSPVTVERLYADLMAPPIGLKEGPIPVLLVAVLLHRSEDVAVYQDGTYQPAITTDLLERLVKTPKRFAVKHVAIRGTRNKVLRALSAEVRSGERRLEPRNESVLTVARPLLTAVGSLPGYSRLTRALSPTTLAVRDALLSSREPDELLFTALPKACGLRSFAVAGRGAGTDPERFATEVRAALDELRDAFPRLLADCVTTLSEELTLLHELPAMRLGLRTRALPLEDTLLEPRLRKFTNHALNTDLEDEAWFEALLNSLVGKPPKTWTDPDVAAFKAEATAVARLFNRVLALHDDFRGREHHGFDAHRITVTNPTGDESTSVVWVDHNIRAELEGAASDALHAAERLLGSKGGQALLALLASRVLRDEPQQRGTPEVTQQLGPTRKERHV